MLCAADISAEACCVSGHFEGVVGLVKPTFFLHGQPWRQISLSGRPACPRVMSTNRMLWIKMSDPKMIQSSCATSFHHSCQNKITGTSVVPKLCRLNNYQARLQQNRSLKPRLMCPTRGGYPQQQSNLAKIKNTIWISCEPWDSPERRS